MGGIKRSAAITVIKEDPFGEEVWRYEGEVIRRTSNSIEIKAIYNNRSVQVGELEFNPGDVFVESYFSDRWYNIFAIFDSANPQFKGWYCNITRPAVIARENISAVDLALDLLVYPDRRWTILDEDEFEQIHLSSPDRESALHALHGLITQADKWAEPFKEVPSLP